MRPTTNRNAPAINEKFHDDEGDVYAIVVYGDGEPETSFIKKQIWKQAEQHFLETERDRASNLEDALRRFDN
jgi:hypothetical protein